MRIMDKKQVIEKYLHKYVDLQLRNKYMNKKEEIPYESMILICMSYDDIKNAKEIKPLIISLLRENNIIKDNGEPNHTEIEKLLSLSEYNDTLHQRTSIYKTGFQQKIIRNKTEAFQDILNIKRKQLIYVYNNQDKYLFKQLGNRLHFISKEEYNNLNKMVLRQHAYAYIKEHPKKCLSYAFNLRFKAISASIQTSYINYGKRTDEYIAPDIDRVELDMIVLKRLSRELKIIQRYHIRWGKEKYHQFLTDKIIEYLKFSAPLWINSEEKYEKYISRLVLEGLPEE